MSDDEKDEKKSALSDAIGCLGASVSCSGVCFCVVLIALLACMHMHGWRFPACR